MLYHLANWALQTCLIIAETKINVSKCYNYHALHKAARLYSLSYQEKKTSQDLQIIVKNIKINVLSRLTQMRSRVRNDTVTRGAIRNEQNKERKEEKKSKKNYTEHTE